MDTKTMTQLLVGFLIGAVILASMVPIFINVQNISGDEVTLENNTNIVLREVQPGDELKCVSTWDSDRSVNVNSWTLNDENITTPAGGGQSWNVGIMSDGVYLQVQALNNTAMGIWYDMSLATPSANYLNGATATDTTRSAIISFTDSEVSVRFVTGSSDTTRTFGYTWGYVVCPYADGEYCAAVSGGTAIVSNVDEVILCGAYTTGDNDTMYSYRNGETYVSNTDYTINVSIETATHEGTTDIYDATVSVDVGGEEFTPYRILVPYEVEGHASGGALYSIIGLLPLVAGVGLLMGAVYYFISRR